MICTSWILNNDTFESGVKKQNLNKYIYKGKNEFR